MEDYAALPALDGYRKSGDLAYGGDRSTWSGPWEGGVALAVVEPRAVRAWLPLAVEGTAVRTMVDVAPDSELGEVATDPL